MWVYADGECMQLKMPEGNGCLEVDVGRANLRKVPVVPTFTWHPFIIHI